MDKYMWLRIPANGFSGRGTPNIDFYGNGDTAEKPGKKIKENEMLKDLDLIKFLEESDKKEDRQVKFETLIICHTHSSPGCVWVKRSSGWVKVCDS
jgi:hypothetical protein